MRSLTYAVLEGNHAILVDPCEMEETKRLLMGKVIDIVFLTHEHYDHISGTDWARSLGAEIIASDICSRNLQDVKLNHSKYYSAFCAAQERLKGDPIPPVKAYTTYADKTFEEELSLPWQGHSLFFRKTPGHSSGGASLLIDEEYLFSGDTIFRDLPSNPDLMCGSAKELERSVSWILSLPPDVLVYPGHYESFTIQEKSERIL